MLALLQDGVLEFVGHSQDLLFGPVGMQLLQAAAGVHDSVLEHEPIWRLGHQKNHEDERDGGSSKTHVERNLPATVIQGICTKGLIGAPGDKGTDQSTQGQIEGKE